MFHLPVRKSIRQMNSFVTSLPVRNRAETEVRNHAQLLVCRVKTRPPQTTRPRRRRLLAPLPTEYTHHQLLTRVEEAEISATLSQYRRQQVIIDSYIKQHAIAPTSSQLSNLLNVPSAQIVAEKNQALSARNRLVTSNLRLVTHLATGIHARLSATEPNVLPLHDLIQESCLALIRSAELYDCSYGRFSSYAYRAIRSACMRHATGHAIVSIPERLRRHRGGKVDGSTAKLLTAAKQMGKVLELDKMISDSSTILDILPSKLASPNKVLEQQDMVEEIRKACETRLKRRDSEILAMRFGLGTEKLVGRVIGERFGISEARVAQIVKGAIKTLELEEKGLMEYLNEFV